ncbi:uncharacterized protein Bfra_009999 [Botrytis fragariae]|uniref:Uncharacterized protein n=1 Tax=Botrytis fragariae TaxID=1964551 RepID=A0A8H6ANS3_9HELO|nr:uncharacterized protein Bfra_009999 [Botrytis fragariae]KAF5870610.1 hypothetical protein Bfra_009999 [Botrytis fragariae]
MVLIRIMLNLFPFRILLLAFPTKVEFVELKTLLVFFQPFTTTRLMNGNKDSTYYMSNKLITLEESHGFVLPVPGFEI